MREYPEPSDDLALAVRRALRAALAGAEPSPQTWRAIRQRIASSPGLRPRPSYWKRWLRPRPGQQALALSVALVAMLVAVNGNSLLSPATPEGPSPRVTSASVRQLPVSDTGDALSGRLLWLAAREPQPQDVSRPHGYLE